MAQFRSKPVTIEAMQVPPVDDIDGRIAFEDWIIAHGGKGEAFFVGSQFLMQTIQGQRVVAEPGEWIICEAQPGRFYPCARDVFAKRYEAA